MVPVYFSYGFGVYIQPSHPHIHCLDVEVVTIYISALLDALEERDVTNIGCLRPGESLKDALTMLGKCPQLESFLEGRKLRIDVAQWLLPSETGTAPIGSVSLSASVVSRKYSVLISKSLDSTLRYPQAPTTISLVNFVSTCAKTPTSDTELSGRTRVCKLRSDASADGDLDISSTWILESFSMDQRHGPPTDGSQMTPCSSGRRSGPPRN